MPTTKINSGKRLAQVLIVDDHPVVRRGLRELIAQTPDLMVCGEADDLPEALDQVKTTQPDVAVVDISLKSGSGIELIKQIKAMHPQVKMLVSSVYDESLYAERALRAGAMGYINKEEALDSIIEAIRQVLGGRVYLSGDMTNRMLHRSITGQRPEQSTVDALSSRELEVFELIGRGFTTSQIAGKLHRSVKTIEAHRENIKRKLRVDSAPELMRYAIQWVQFGGAG